MEGIWVPYEHESIFDTAVGAGNCAKSRYSGTWAIFGVNLSK